MGNKQSFATKVVLISYLSDYQRLDFAPLSIAPPPKKLKPRETRQRQRAAKGCSATQLRYLNPTGSVKVILFGAPT